MNTPCHSGGKLSLDSDTSALNRRGKLNCIERHSERSPLRLRIQRSGSSLCVSELTPVYEQTGLELERHMKNVKILGGIACGNVEVAHRYTLSIAGKLSFKLVDRAVSSSCVRDRLPLRWLVNFL